MCQKPSHAIQAYGYVTAESRSWYLNEGTDMDLTLLGVTIKPYSDQLARMLNTTLKGKQRAQYFLTFFQ